MQKCKLSQTSLYKWSLALWHRNTPSHSQSNAAADILVALVRKVCVEGMRVGVETMFKSESCIKVCSVESLKYSCSELVRIIAFHRYSSYCLSRWWVALKWYDLLFESSSDHNCYLLSYLNVMNCYWNVNEWTSPNCRFRWLIYKIWSLIWPKVLFIKEDGHWYLKCGQSYLWNVFNIIESNLIVELDHSY
jgi:hypothetical protein